MWPELSFCNFLGRHSLAFTLAFSLSIDYLTNTEFDLSLTHQSWYRCEVL